MGTRYLDKIFSPKSIAVIGASDTPGKIGYTLLKNLIGSGFEGVVYPINPNRESLQSIHAYPSVDKIPKVVDLAIIATPASTVPKIVEECGEAGIKGLIIISAGFKEMGKGGAKLEGEISRMGARYGMRILGPNCLGFIRPGLKLNASFAGKMALPGDITFISQSGALCTSVLDWSVSQNIGFSNFVSIGSMVDVDFADLIDYFGADPKTRSIILYIESITGARKFMSAARSFAKTKPIIVVKSGRFEEGARAATSHTGALAGEDSVYDAVFKRAGIVRVNEIDDLFNCSAILAMQPNPKGPNLAIITNAGGPGVMACDSLVSYGGKLAHLSRNSMRALNRLLPEYWSKSNPVDILGDASAKRYGRSLEICARDKNIDGLLLILTPQAVTQPTETARTIVKASKNTTKPILVSFMGGEDVAQARRILHKNNIPNYETPTEAVKSFIYMYRYGRNLQSLYEMPEEVEQSRPKMDRINLILDKAAKERRGVLTEVESKSVLAEYGIEVSRTGVAKTKEEAIRLAKEIGFPVVLKIYSKDITHKTDVGGVLLYLKTTKEVRQGFLEIIKNVRRENPGASIEGITVQKMIQKPYELIIGSKKDSTFGSVILFGLGGIAVETLKDKAVGLPPLNQNLARMLIEETRAYELLKGIRGRPAANLRLLEKTLVNFSNLVIDFPQIKEIDINPFMMDEKEGIAVDARMVIDSRLKDKDIEKHKYLTLPLYPKEFIKRFGLNDETPVLLRPIRPEDEPLLVELFGAFSEETIMNRFFELIKSMTHERLISYCHNDYYREIAIVGEIEEEGRKRLIGVGRLVCDANVEKGEYAVVVGDPWQRKGLGTELLDYCCNVVAKKRGLKEINAVVMSHNYAMIKIFERQGFTIERDFEEGVVNVKRILA